MSKKSVISLWLILTATLSVLHVVSAIHLYVKPSHFPASSNLTCPDQDYACVTLEQLMTNFSSLSPEGSNVTLLFLEGNFTLSSGFYRFQNLNSLAIESAINQIANLQFLKKVDLSISNISTVKIRRIKISSNEFGEFSISTITVSTFDNIVLQDIQMSNFIIRIRPIAYSQMPVGDIKITVEECVFIKSSLRFGTDFNVKNMNLSIVNSTFTQSRKYAVTLYNNNCKCYFQTLSINLTKLQIARNSRQRKNTAIYVKLCSENLAGEIYISDSVIENNDRGVRVKTLEKVRNLIVTIVNTAIRFHKVSAISVTHLNRNMRINVESCTLDRNKFGFNAFSKSASKDSNDTMEVSVHNTSISNSEDEGMLVKSFLKHRMKVTVTDSTITSSLNTGAIIKAEQTTIQHVTFHNTTFSSNQNGGLIILSEANCQCSEVSISNCTVENNRLTSVANRAIGPQQSSAGITLWFVQERTHICIEKVRFLHNHDLSTNPVIFQIVNSKETTIKDCEFIGNHGSSMQSYYNQITFAGHNVFTQNRGLNGAAVTLLHSRIVIPKNTKIDFIGNKAERVGGSIFIRGLPKSVNIEAHERCFYQLPSVQESKDLKVLNSSLNFLNNSAEIGGMDIYGSPLRHSCFVSDHRSVQSHEVAKAEVFRFHSLSESHHSSISSDPQRVCLCDEVGVPQCANMSYIVQEQTRFPGEKFNISSVLVGDEFGTISGIVHGTLLKDSSHILDKKYQSQEVSFKKCNPLEYSIQSTAQKETLVLTANKMAYDEYVDLEKLERIIKTHIDQNKRAKLGVHSELLYQPIFINITLKDCPVGFQLDPVSHACKCSSKLLEIGIEECEITNRTGLIYRQGTLWITALPHRGIVVHRYCPNHYCKRESLPLDPVLPDAQCALNHSGILCGGCSLNYSLTIGSNRCIHCQNNNGLSLLIFFVAAGFLLVFFIKILDLTVSKGTINGLVFYANIAWSYQSVIFPPNITDHPYLKVLHVFLAWLNLDFGIETCFAVGLTAYWKTWLQFVFPLYVWAIMGGMILLSRYSTRLTNALGNNTVPVLATLFLLSYAKLARTIITVLGFSVLRYKGHIIRIVWSFDGNLKYFGAEHACLSFVALFAILLLWLPYVFTLVAVPYLKRKSHLKCLRWINSWKPFYDAYFGPLKDKHHYWIGLLLIIRGALFLTLFLASSSYPDLTILLMTLTSTLILLYTSLVENVYKNRILGFSENLCFVNLILLGSGTLYFNAFDEPKSVIVQISVTLACIQFVGTVVFHVLQKVRARWWRNAEKVQMTREQRKNTNDTETSGSNDNLREALLEDSV